MMRVLLVGDYSSVHKNLRDGLRKMGIDAVVASGGDYWKRYERDINLGDLSLHYPLKAVDAVFKRVLLLPKIKNFDIVQFINPFCIFGKRIILNRLFVKYVREFSKKFFFLACGDDSYYWKVARKKVPYGVFDDFLKYDLKKDAYWMEDESSYEYNRWVVSLSDGVIPLAYEYYLAYEYHEKCLKPLPFPVNIDDIPYRENKFQGQLLVYHGVTVPGFKGTRYIQEAFEEIQKKYPNDIRCIVGGKLPFREYIRVLENFNVIVDQTNGLSWGMNALQAMSAGRVVLGGNEPPARELYGLREDEVPIVNIRPNVSSIVQALEGVLENRREIGKLGWKSRMFVERFHDCRKVAKKFLEVWGESKREKMQ